MKFKYQIFEKTDIDPEILKEYICLRLEANKYRIVNKTDDEIVFDRYRSLFNSRTASVSKIDEGKFEVIKSEDFVNLKLSYSKSYLQEIIALPILILCGLIIDNLILIFPLIMIIIYIGELASLKYISRNLLNEMITLDNKT